MNIIVGIVFFSLAFSIEGQNELGFLYGLLGRLHSQDDTTTVLQDTSIIHTGDEIRINVGYKKDTHFYVIFKGSEGKFDLLYPQNNQLVDSIVELPDTIYTTVLHWTQFDDAAGYETFFLVNSILKQDNLQELFQNYDTVNDKKRKRVAKKIQNEIDRIDPGKKRELNSFGSRLEKPIVAGITYRGDGEDEALELSLTHSCNGTSGIAFKKILLNHQ